MNPWGDVRCPNDGEMTNMRCWKCGWIRPDPGTTEGQRSMDDLVTWLRAQLDDDERKVAAMEREEMRVQTAPIFGSHPLGWLAGVDIYVSSKRWRDEIDAKRRMIDEAIRLDGYDSEFEFLELLALPYAGRDGWREEWRP